MTDTSTRTNEDEFYDDATSDFPKAEHLAPSVPPNFGAGRLLAIWALSEGTRKNDEGKPYPFVETITVTLDDGPDGLDAPGWSEDAARLVEPGVQRLDKFQHSTGGLVSRLQKRLTGKTKDGVPLRFRPLIGRINTQPSSRNKHVPAFSIATPSDTDRETIRTHGDMIRSINAELETAATTGGDSSNPDTSAFNE